MYRCNRGAINGFTTRKYGFIILLKWYGNISFNNLIKKEEKMQLPEEILNKVIEISYDINKKEIAQNFRKISDKYMGDKKGDVLLAEEQEAIAYSIARMPATYGAVRTAINHVLEMFVDESFETIIDVGAGTGAATLALMQELEEHEISVSSAKCLEREEAMISVGKTLFSESSSESVKNASWIKFDINDMSSMLENETMKADIVITSYMLNEFAEEKIFGVIDKLWSMTNKMLLIVDPGTPKDHKRMIKIKNYLYEKGGNIVAPCTCNSGCHLPETDWCHFTCRVERTKIQKQVKNANVPYEDEKFTYLAVLKDKSIKPINGVNRIIRHPVIRSNMIEVKLCSNGEIMNRIYTKKDKETYKMLKKAKVGDLVEIR